MALLVLTVVFTGCATHSQTRVKPPAAAPSVPASASNAALAAVIDRYWAESEKRNYYGLLQQGKLVEAIPAGSLDEARNDARSADQYLAELAAIPRDRLTPNDGLSLDILVWSLQQRRNAEKHWWYEFPVTPYTNLDLTVAMQALAANPLSTEAERSAGLSLVESITRRLQATSDRIDRQAERGIRLPAPAAGPAADYFDKLQATYAAIPADVERRLSGIEGDERDRYLATVRAAVDAGLQPARVAVVARLRKLQAEGPATVGLGQYPGGREAYLDLVRFHTSMDVTPEDIKAYGEARVRRVNQEIEALARELGIEGGREGIRRMLQTDARFLAKTPEDVAQRYMQEIARIEPLIPKYFAEQPRALYGVTRLDPAAEATMTFGYYEPPTASNPRGEYHFNGSKLEQRPLLFTAPIIYHELVPGHHFQIALQLENEQLPPFRRLAGEFGFNAYTEGWAEYAAELAGEMGLYETHDRLGRLMLDAFLSARLVVDPGMNYFGWSLEQARQYMRDNTFQSETEIQTETLRYSTAIPGQALGYKMGHRALDELRAAVRARKGADFDIRALHRAVLDGGAMPMAVLRAKVERTFGMTPGSKP